MVGTFKCSAGAFSSSGTVILLSTKFLSQVHVLEGRRIYFHVLFTTITLFATLSAGKASCVVVWLGLPDINCISFFFILISLIIMD